MSVVKGAVLFLCRCPQVIEHNGVWVIFPHPLSTSVRTPSFVLFRFSQFIFQRRFSSLMEVVIVFYFISLFSFFFFLPFAYLFLVFCFSLHGVELNVWNKFFRDYFAVSEMRTYLGKIFSKTLTFLYWTRRNLMILVGFDITLNSTILP